VPAAAESGLLPGYDVTTWYGLFAPKGTPQPVVAKLNKVMNDILADEDVKARMVSVGVIVQNSTPQAFGAFMHSEYKRWDAVREAAHIERQ
jgi:tripartite-type tricarboxylate transporter receptor subunit TctC